MDEATNGKPRTSTEQRRGGIEGGTAGYIPKVARAADPYSLRIKYYLFIIYLLFTRSQGLQPTLPELLIIYLFIYLFIMWTRPGSRSPRTIIIYLLFIYSLR